MTVVSTITYDPATRRARQSGFPPADGEIIDGAINSDSIEDIQQRVFGWVKEPPHHRYLSLRETSWPLCVGFSCWLPEDVPQERAHLYAWEWSVYWQLGPIESYPWITELFGPPPELDDPSDVRRDDNWSINGIMSPHASRMIPTNLGWALEVAFAVAGFQSIRNVVADPEQSLTLGRCNTCRGWIKHAVGAQYEWNDLYDANGWCRICPGCGGLRDS